MFSSMSCRTAFRTTRDSAEVLSRARNGEIQALIPAHAVTTLHYVLAKAAGQPKADQTVDWLLAHFEIAPAGKDALRRARELAFQDFEDAVVASLAEAAQCGHVITRNEADFAGSPVPAVSPTAFLVPKGRLVRQCSSSLVRSSGRLTLSPSRNSSRKTPLVRRCDADVMRAFEEEARVREGERAVRGIGERTAFEEPLRAKSRVGSVWDFSSSGRAPVRVSLSNSGCVSPPGRLG